MMSRQGCFHVFREAETSCLSPLGDPNPSSQEGQGTVSSAAGMGTDESSAPSASPNECSDDGCKAIAFNQDLVVFIPKQIALLGYRLPGVFPLHSDLGLPGLSCR